MKKYKSTDYIRLSANNFQKLVKSKIDKCQTIREYIDKLKPIFADDHIFVINHVKNKFYLHSLRKSYFDGDDRTFNALYCVNVDFLKEGSYVGSSESIGWLLSEEPVRWKWKFGILKSLLQ